MLTPIQRDEFTRSGLLRLPGTLPAPAVAAMRDRAWAFLASEHGHDPDRPSTWAPGPVRRLQSLRRQDPFAEMAAEPVLDALTDLLDTWQRPKSWGLPLITFPDPAAEWRLPTTGWHLDSHGPDHALPGVTVFTFLMPTVRTGGGTVVLAGSHHLVNHHIEATGTWKSAEIRTALAAAHPWLSSVWRGERRPGDKAVLDGAEITLHELTGDPGDVILMHSRTLHAAAPNTSASPRMMLVEIINR
jgi:hypothetical protein